MAAPLSPASIERRLAPPGPLFEVRSAPGKGLGVFARLMIMAGTKIIAEAPLMTVLNGYYFKADVQNAFELLTPEKQAKFMELASAHGQSPSDWPSRFHESINPIEKARIMEQQAGRLGTEANFYSIFMTNAMQCGPDLSATAVFETVCRINHSCLPNAHFSWNENLTSPDGTKGMMTIHANRHIIMGEEITIAYCDPLFEDALRRWELQHYGIRCNCKACSDFLSNSDGRAIENPFVTKSRQRRFRLREIDAELGRYRYSIAPQPRPTVRHVKRLALLLEESALMKEEGLINPTLAKAYFEIAQQCRRAGDHETAFKAAKEGYDTIVICLGRDSPLARRRATFFETVKREAEGAYVIPGDLDIS